MQTKPPPANDVIIDLDISEITIDPGLSCLMPIDPELVDRIAESIKQRGYLRESFIIFWLSPDGRKVLLDGRHRIEALLRSGRTSVPALGKAMDGADVWDYVLSQQIQRRQTSLPVILHYLLHVGLYDRGGRRLWGESTSVPLIGDDRKRLKNVAADLHVSMRQVKSARKIYNSLPEIQRVALQEKKLSVYEIVTEHLLAKKRLPRTISTFVNISQKFIKMLPLRNVEKTLLQEKLNSLNTTIDRYVLELISADLSNNHSDSESVDPVARSNPTEKGLGRALRNEYLCWTEDLLLALGCFELQRLSKGFKRETQKIMIGRFVEWLHQVTGKSITSKAVDHYIQKAKAKAEKEKIVDFQATIEHIEARYAKYLLLKKQATSSGPKKASSI